MFHADFIKGDGRMILAIDIGNTNIVIGGFENDSISFTARVATDVLRTEEQYAVEIHQILHLYVLLKAGLQVL